MNLQAVIERVWKCIWRPESCNFEMHLEAVMKSEFGDALGCQDRVEFRDVPGGHDRARLEKHWEAVIE
jgi:hypothetical protein